MKSEQKEDQRIEVICWTRQASGHKRLLDHPVKRPIKIRDIKHHVWQPSSNEKVPHDSTISRILRNELNITYKVLQKRNLKTENSSNIRLFHESLAIQVFLRAKDYELIYIDEFSYSSKKKGMSRLGCKGITWILYRQR